MFSKIEVNGDGAAPLYQWLREQQPGEGETDDITWNFEKFLIDRDGNVVQRFGPGVTPEADRRGRPRAPLSRRPVAGAPSVQAHVRPAPIAGSRRR